MSFKIYQVIDDESDPGLSGVSLRAPEAVLPHGMVKTMATVCKSVEEAVLAEVVSHATQTLVSKKRSFC